MLTPPTTYPICTIANTPRMPEHCIEWASVLEWPKEFKGKLNPSSTPDLPLTFLLQTRNSTTMTLITSNGCTSVLFPVPKSSTLRVSLGRLRRVLSRTSFRLLLRRMLLSLVSAAGRDLLLYADLPSPASCCNEAFKIATTSNPYLDNYMMVRHALPLLPRGLPLSRSIPAMIRSTRLHSNTKRGPSVPFAEGSR
jgi:ubiquitin-activating enzyme E1 C